MCTATWLRDASGYRVLFNRDEARSRPPALPPELDERRGVRFLAPRDTEAGGTWLAVNELGLTLGLLNLYRAPIPLSGDFTSRGLLVAELADCGSTSEVAGRLAATDLAAYRPFTLFALSDGPPTSIWDWDGRRLTSRGDGEPLPITSSAHLDGAAAAARREVLETYRRKGPLTVERLLEFHRSHAPKRGPLSPCMHRPEAATVSLSMISVEADRVSLSYAAGPACSAILEPGPSLARRAS